MVTFLALRRATEKATDALISGRLPDERAASESASSAQVGRGQSVVLEHCRESFG